MKYKYTTFRYDNNTDIQPIANAIIDTYSKYKNVKGKYLPFVASFDIETTAVVKSKKSYMYIWQFSLNNDFIVYGRTWDEYINFTTLLVSTLGLNDKRRLLVGVHNLGYEFQFIRKRFNWSKIFAIEQRKPLYCVDERGIEYTCTYLMSGLALGKLGTETTKLNYDYAKQRNNKTPLTTDELHYCFNDVIIVVEYLHKQIEQFGSIKNIPRTITGVVRKYIKNKVKENKEKFNYIPMIPRDKLELLTLQNAFCGGFTHSNPYNTNITIENVNSYDLTSAYPSVMVSRYFPKGSAIFTNNITIDTIKQPPNKKLSIFVVKFYDLINTFEYDSYLSISKCKTTGEVVANGRIYSAKTCITTTTNIDFSIIEKVYNWSKIEFLYGYVYDVDLLPLSYYQSIQDFYKAKTELKNVDGFEDVYQMKKGCLNSLYGMCVTNEFKNTIIYENGEWNETPIEIEKKLKEIKNGSPFSAYVYGVFITAYVRQIIWSAIFELKDRYIYTDTDSIKFTGDDFSIFEKYNTYITKQIPKCYDKRGIVWDGVYYTKEKKPKPLGVWDYEGIYSKAKFLGAKKYLYVQDGHFNCAVAGCPKQSIINVITKKGDPFENFTNDLYISPNESGKLCHCYNDNEHSDVVDGVEMFEKSSVCLLDTDFTMGLSAKFLKFIYIINNYDSKYLMEMANYVL